MSTVPKCSHCGAALTTTLVDLGEQPLSNSYVKPEDAGKPEPYYPLHTRVCGTCFLVAADDVVPADVHFSADYAYFSSFSTSWLAHAKAYADKMTAELSLGGDDLVMEIASNDGYLLQYFAQAGIPVLGIEPTANTANAAALKGVPSYVAFWGNDLATKLQADGITPSLIASANVLAHVPDINDFVRGVATILQGDAVYTVEFPHLLNMMQLTQFDTIYHEHYSYLSLIAVQNIFEAAGLRVFEVEELPTHGGSLRVYGCLGNASHETRPGVAAVRAREEAAGLNTLEGYAGFTARCEAVRAGLRAFLDQADADGKSVAAYGAAAKGNTLLNYCDIKADRIAYCVDRNPAKQNTLLPGSQVPVLGVDALEGNPPDYLLILPWNLKDEISAQMAHLKDTSFVVAIPEVTVWRP